jgi:opacity protein-like surface antigen
MRLLVTAVAALAVLTPALSSAQPVSIQGGAGPDTYVELHLGAFLPQHDDLDEFETGWGLGGTFGARFTPNLGVEAELGFVRARDTATDQTLLDVPFAASLRLRLPLKVAELSALAGAGLHFARLDTDVLGAGSVSDSATAFGFHVGAAAAFNLSPTMLFGVEARRTFVKADFEGVDVNLDGLRLALTLGYHF